MRRHRKFALLFSLLPLLPLAAGAAARASSHHLTVQLLSENSAIRPGTEFWVATHFALEPQWHLYWTNPGDSGEPPRIEWELPAGYTAGPIQWPTPRRINAWQFVDYGYEDELVLLTRIRAPATASGTADLSANVRWAVCREVCIADRARLDLSVPVVTKAMIGPARALFARTRANLPKPLPADWRASAFSAGDSFLLTVRAGPAGLPLQEGTEPVFFPLEKQQIENAAPQKVLRNGNTLQFILKQSEQLTQRPDVLKGVVSFGRSHAFSIEARVQRK
jgi:DsbC/DsbD-like thiol-disulfide interchange protein